VHTLQVLSHGSLILGDQGALWHGQTGGKHWKSYGAPLNNLMPLCVAKMGNVVLACTTFRVNGPTLVGKPNGLWRSTDSGKHWQRTTLPDKYVVVLATNSFVPNTVVAFAEPDGSNGTTGNGGLWASTDAGATWHRINTSLANSAYNAIIMLPGKPFSVIFATNFTISRTNDGGTTWHSSSKIPQTLSMTPSRTVAGQAFLGTGNAIYRSQNDGVTWQRISSQPPTPILVSGGGSPERLYGYGVTNNSYIYSFQNGSAVAGTNPVPASQPIVIVADPSTPNRIYAAYNFPLRIFESQNGGRTWTHIL
jgi:photosystem II stability/assembly factor-like uncharacterized protein